MDLIAALAILLSNSGLIKNAPLEYEAKPAKVENIPLPVPYILDEWAYGPGK